MPTVPVRTISPQGRPAARRRSYAPTLRNSRRATNNGPWGHIYNHKDESVIRIAFNNCGGLPVDHEGDKHTQLINSMTTIKADVLGIQEHNLNLQHMSGRNTWKSRFRKWGRIHTNAAWNIHTTVKEKHLFGGSAIFVGAHHSHRVVSHGSDDRGLGRWSWAVLQGQHGQRLRVISAYRPVTDSCHRPTSVFSQQESVLLAHRDERNPRTAIFDDLQKHIQRWQEEGDWIILGMDANKIFNVVPQDLHAGVI